MFFKNTIRELKEAIARLEHCAGVIHHYSKSARKQTNEILRELQELNKILRENRE